MLQTRARRPMIRLASWLGLGLAIAACGGKSSGNGGGALVGKAPLSLGSYGAEWFGPLAEGLDGAKGLDWKGLLGNVVYLEFGFLR